MKLPNEVLNSVALAGGCPPPPEAQEAATSNPGRTRPISTIEEGRRISANNERDIYHFFVSGFLASIFLHTWPTVLGPRLFLFRGLVK